MRFSAFDLETAGRSEEELVAMMPEFEADERLVDPVKVARSIEEKRRKWIEGASLSPLTGRIVAAVYMRPVGEGAWEPEVIDGDRIGEAELVRQMFARFGEANMGAAHKVFGWNSWGFDGPWLFAKALEYGIPLPTGWLTFNGRFPQWASWFVDLRMIWTLGDKMGKGSLGAIGSLLGVGRKNGDGADFARLWRDPATRLEALNYVINDGWLTVAVGKRMAEVGSASLFGRGSGGGGR